MEQLSLFDAPIPVARPNPAHRHTSAEVRAVQSAGETLRAAGWRRTPGDALGLTWTHPDLRGYVVEFCDLDDLAQAAALLERPPRPTPVELLRAMGVEVDDAD